MVLAVLATVLVMAFCTAFFLLFSYLIACAPDKRLILLCLCVLA